MIVHDIITIVLKLHFYYNMNKIIYYTYTYLKMNSPQSFNFLHVWLEGIHHLLPKVIRSLLFFILVFLLLVLNQQCLLL